MKVYLAGPYKPEIIAFFREFEGELNEIGIETTSTWYRRDGISIIRPETKTGSKEHLQVLSLHGQIDLFEVSEADTILVAMCAPGEYHTGGRHVETGYSLVSSLANGRPKRVFVVGAPKENIFHHLPGVIHLPDWQSAFQLLQIFQTGKNRGPKIIGLSGKKGAGKTTVGQLIGDAFGHESRHFATALREEICFYVNFKNAEMVEVVKGYPDKAEAERLVALVKEMEGKLEPSMMSTPGIKERFRTLQQYYGTEHRRKKDPEYWTSRLDWSGKLTIGDVRFGGLELGSEVGAVTSRGGVVIYVFDEEKEQQVDGHASEQLRFIDCDYTLLWKKNNPEWCVEAMVRLFGTTLHFDITEEQHKSWYNTLTTLGRKS